MMSSAERSRQDVRVIELRKQISLFVPLSEWRAIRGEAARRKIPITELCRRWMRPELEALMRGGCSAVGTGAGI